MESRRIRRIAPAALLATIALPTLSARARDHSQRIVSGSLRVDSTIVDGHLSNQSSAPAATPPPSAAAPTPVQAPTEATPQTSPAAAPSATAPPAAPATTPAVAAPPSPPASTGAGAPAAPVSPAPPGLPEVPTIATAQLPVMAVPEPFQGPPPPAAVPGTPESAAETTVTPAATVPATTPVVPATPPVSPATPPVTTPETTSSPGTLTPPVPSPEIGSEAGTEDPNGEYSLEAPGGVIYDAERGLALAQGAVRFHYRDFEVSGDRGVVDYNVGRAVLTGNLTVTVRGRVLHGRSLTFDLESGQWRLSQLETTFEPNFFPPGTVLQPIYVTGGSVQGIGDQLSGSNFTFSSCDRGHYYLRTNRIDFYRDANGNPSRIALRRSALYLFRRRILPLPAYVISLSGDRSRRIGLQPTVGQNEEDGFFAKTTYDLRATNRYTDTLLLDLLQKRGLGLGITREFAGAAGILSLYAISGRDDQGRQLDARLERAFHITSNLTGNVHLQSADNNQTNGFGNSNRDGSFQLTRQTDRAQTDFQARFSNSGGQGFSNNDMGLSFGHRQNFGRGVTLDTQSLFAASGSTGAPDARTTDNRALLGFRGQLFDALASIELHNDLVRSNGSSINQLSRLPELALTSNTDRLKLPLLSQLVPGDFAITLGDYVEPRFGDTTGRSETERSRANLLYSPRSREVSLVDHRALQSRAIFNGNFTQSFYSDSSAKYDYAYAAALDNRLGPFSAQLNYSKMRTLGFTPLSFDFTTPSETFDATLGFQPNNQFRLSASLGRDLQNGISNDVIGRLQWQPGRNFYASLSSNYSPEQKTFGDVVGNFHIARQATFFGGSVDLGLRYSPALGQLAQANIQTTFSVTRGTQVEALASYNGYSQQFDNFQFRVTQDLHCFNLYVTYDDFRKQVRVDLALKAFPFFDTRYGIGAGGQGFSPIIGGVQ